MMDTAARTTLGRWRNLRIVALDEYVMVEHIGDNSLAAPYEVACDMQELENGRLVYQMTEDEIEWLNGERMNQLIREWLR